MPTYYCHCEHKVSVPESVFHLLDIAAEITLESLLRSGVKPPAVIPTAADLYYPQLGCIAPLLNKAAMCCEKPAYSPSFTPKEQPPTFQECEELRVCDELK